MTRPVKATDRDKRHGKRQAISRAETLGKRKLREYFLIVTNGCETELRYFERIARKMPRNTIRSITVDFRNSDPRGLVEHALKTAEENHYQHVAAVFDKDDFEHFNNAISKMKAAALRSKKVEFYTAYSNECFELWMLLHFQETLAPLGRKSLFDKLQNYISRAEGGEFRYDKADFPFDTLEECGDRHKAIRRAKRMLQAAKRRNKTKPWTINPSTEVHVLMEKLDAVIEETQ